MANSQNKNPNNIKQGQQSLSADQLSLQLSQLADQYKIKTWCLAYSGGVDSQVLLHLLGQTNLDIFAVYIDHGLQDESVEWARHCEYQCQQLNIPFQAISVNAHAGKGESPEAAARSARYNAFKKILKPGMCLLTAQHQDDQAETVLLQLLRGGNAAGVAAMPKMSAFESAWHCRPLLNVSQQLILDYAQVNKLTWVEDPSNQHQNFDRNFLRHSVIPVIQQRWPALNKILSVFSEQQAENTRLLDELAKIDLQPVLKQKDQLDISQLSRLDNARLRNTLRYWIKQNQSPLPSRAVLQQIVTQIQNPSHDTQMQVKWSGVEVRRFREGLYLLKQMSHDPTQRFQWNGKQALKISSIEKKLLLEENQSSNNVPYVLKHSILSLPLTVRFRQGGERIQPAGRDARNDLKSLFQASGVPSWQRDRIPLLYAEDKLVAVVGYWLADEFVCKGEGLSPVLTGL